MTALRFALAQVNPIVGALAENCDLVVARTREAAMVQADLVAFPEMVINGYPTEDIGLRRSFIEASRAAVEDLARRLEAEGLGDIAVVVGYLDGDPDAPARLGVPQNSPRNAAAVLQGGRIRATYAKHHLPNYGVFDEMRYFVPGDELSVVRVRGVDVAIVICEDLWQEGGPAAAVKASGAGLLLVLNGSPYERAKNDVRLDLCRRRAAEAGCTLAYVNMIGGQDELVFEGDSMVVAADGTLLARAGQFEESLLVIDLDIEPATSSPEHFRPVTLADGTTLALRHTVVSNADATLSKPALPAVDQVTPRLDPLEELYRALVMGLRDYVEKNGFRTVALGMSGGIDSALVGAIACDALGADRVFGVSMPSRYSSDHSRGDAYDQADRSGMHLRTVPIEPMFAAYMSSLELSGLAEENLQARIRGMILMALSNQEGHLVLATGNKSELAVGYSTIYGDAVGGFAPIKDVPKVLVWQLSHWRNDYATARGQVAPIAPNSITKPPSAELRPGQLDSDSLPDYDKMDAVIAEYVEQDRGIAEIIDEGFEPAMVERVLRMTDRAEYKRRQYPPGTKVSRRNFGRDRRMPMTTRWREDAPEA